MEKEIAKSIYEVHLYKTKEPSIEKKVWKEPNGNQLGIVFIEFREMEWLKYILYQVANIYGGKEEVSLYIVHGTNNKEYFKNLLKDWVNVQYIELPYENVGREKYAELCCDANLYKNFKNDFILKMEWDSYIRKEIPEVFFNYSYVGAPWTGFPNDYPDNPHIRVGNKLVGNGGFSLRKVSRMIEVCSKYNNKPKKLGEDVHITNCLREDEIPNVELAKQFSVEWVHHNDPVGLHQVWMIYPIEVFSKWF
jgi:hypothetical protein